MSPTSRADPVLGRLLESRRQSPTGYYVAAVFMLLAPQTLALYSIFASEDRAAGQRTFLFSLCAALGLVGFIPFLVMGLKRGTRTIAVHEMGLRITTSKSDTKFLYGEIAQVQTKTFKGMLASVTFILATNQSHTVEINSPEDAELLTKLLDRLPLTT